MAVTLPVALLIASTAISTVGIVQQGIAANKQGKLQAGILAQQATSERLQAEAREDDFRRAQSRAFASRRAGLGASGVQQAAGSPLLVSEDFAGEVELQALRIRSGGEVRATRLEQQALLSRFAGKSAQTSSFFRGGSLLLSGAGKAFGGLPSTPTAPPRGI